MLNFFITLKKIVMKKAILLLLFFICLKSILSQENIFYLHPEDFEIVVNYAYSIEEIAVKDSHHFSSFHINSKNFPKVESKAGEELVLVKIIQFKNPIKTDDLMVILKNNNFRPANIFELLAFSKKYQKYQLMFPIVALGSSFVNEKGSSLVPSISSNITKRSVYTVWSDEIWSTNFRFLVIPVKKIEASLLK